MNYYTTKEQAKKLATIVNSDTADMSYIDGTATVKPYTKAIMHIEEHNEILPCWSAGRIMYLFPPVIEVNGIEYYPLWKKTVGWILTYEHDEDVLMFNIGDLIEISIAMLEDLKEEES